MWWFSLPLGVGKSLVCEQRVVVGMDQVVQRARMVSWCHHTGNLPFRRLLHMCDGAVWRYLSSSSTNSSILPAFL